MEQTLQRLDPDRRRRRIRLLAERADARAVLDRLSPGQAYSTALRGMIAVRRRYLSLR